MKPTVLGLLSVIALSVAVARGADRDASRKMPAEEGVRQLDRDGDGRLSRTEAPWPRLFGQIDRDGDGYLTLEELRGYAQRRGRGRRRGGEPAPRIPMPPMTKHLDIRYADVEGVDPSLLSLDLYAPKTRGPHPAMVMIHGGGWRRGDKGGVGMTQLKAPHFVGAGYVYVSVNYRLSPAVKHPVHVQDVARALAWVHTNVGKYGGDPDRLFVMGHSAGAHLAALVSTDRRRLQAEGKDLGIIKGTVCLDTAAYDVPRFVNELGAGRAMRRLYETAFGSTEEAWRDASPRHHVAAGKHIPPMLFFHTGRRMAGDVLSNELARALVAAGTPARAVHAADKDHAGINACIGQPGDPYTKLIMQFLAKPEQAGKLRLNRRTERRRSAAATQDDRSP